MKGICLIWSRGRHFSPSLSDPRAEISGILVTVRRSSATSRSTTYWFKLFRPEWMKTNFHMNGWAPGLALKKRPKIIRKWSIVYNLNNTYGYTRQPLWNLVLDLGNGVVCIFHIFGRQCYASNLRRHRRWHFQSLQRQHYQNDTLRHDRYNHTLKRNIPCLLEKAITAFYCSYEVCNRVITLAIVRISLPSLIWEPKW